MENKITYEIIQHQTVIHFFGEVDINHVGYYRSKIQTIFLLDDGDVIFDFKNTTFIDSAGIGLVLGRFQSLEMQQRKLSLCALSKTAYKVFELSGLFELMDYLQEVKL